MRPQPGSFHAHMTECARAFLAGVLQRTAGNVTHAARAAKVSRPTFYKLCGYVELNVDAYRPDKGPPKPCKEFMNWIGATLNPDHKHREREKADGLVTD